MMVDSLRISFFSLLFLLSGCADVQIEDYADSGPRLDIAAYFAGTTRGWGMVQDYSGEVQRQFTVTIKGSYEDGILTLDESFLFSNGETDQRVWEFERIDTHRWVGTASDVEGQVEASQYGHAFHMRYPLEIAIDDRMITFTMNDWMYLQPDGRLINRTDMQKFGFTVGEITLFFERD